MVEAAVCVYCRQRPVDPRRRPFCSERCRMADLGRWLGGEYRVAGPAQPGAAGEPPAEEPFDEAEGSWPTGA